MITTILLEVNSLNDAFYIAAKAATDSTIGKCLQFIPLMLFLHFLIAASRAYLGDMRLDFSPLIKVILIWICVAAYWSLADASFAATNFFTNSFATKNEILKTLGSLSTNSYVQKHKVEFGMPWSKNTFSIPFNDSQSFFTWLLISLENGLALIIRIFIERIRAMLLGFILAVGPFALTFSTVPGLGGTFAHWFRVFLTTSFWSLTLGVLDTLMIAFNNSFDFNTYKGVGSGMAEGAQVMDLVIVNAAIILMYLSVPVLTSFYIGASASGAFLQAGQRFGNQVMGGARNYINKLSNRE